jgi:F0F1-type ATP synthase alpha subunit
MEFNDFCNEIRDNIGEYLLGYDFDNIQLQEVTHNNNTTHMGLLISRSEVNVAPTIYMEQYYKQYQDTGDMDAVIKEIAETYKASLESTNDLRTEIFNQKEQYFSNCYLKVVNYEKNKNMLQDVPYKKYMDLAVTIRMLVRVDETGMASAIVTHDHTSVNM